MRILRFKPVLNGLTLFLLSSASAFAFLAVPKFLYGLMSARPNQRLTALVDPLLDIVEAAAV